MKKELTFYICEHCKNVVVKISDSTKPLSCCGEEMKFLIANTKDAAVEKHVPVVERVADNKIQVRVGEVEHPMAPEHFIEFIVMETEEGFSVHYLQPGEKPVAEFTNDKKVIAVYEYCNLHGLWKTTV